MVTFTHIVVGKWHKDSFTNGDVVDILTAMNISEHISDEKDHFHFIVKSSFPNCSATKYKLYEKALKVKRKTEPRKSRRRRGKASSKETPGNEHTLITLSCILNDYFS